MSVSIDYFFNHTAPIDRLVDEFRLRLGFDMRPDEDNPSQFSGLLLGLACDLFRDHGLTNDGDMNFESYRYQLSAWSSTIEMQRYQLVRMAALVYGLHLGLGIGGMLTFD